MRSLFSSNMVFALFHSLYILLCGVIPQKRQTARAAHPACKTWKKHCQRRERRFSQYSAYHEQALRETVQAFGQVQKDAHADAHNVVCATCERCSELLTHVFRAGTGQQDNTRPALTVFVAEGEDSRRGSVHGVLRSLARSSKRTFRSSEEPSN